MMALAGLEHGFAPWRPFYLTYAALCIAIPLLAGGIQVQWAKLGLWRWALLIALTVAAQMAFAFALSSGWPALAPMFGAPADAMSQPHWNFTLALPTAIARYASTWNTDPTTMVICYVVFITAWAGIGEEFFYRGYLHEHLRGRGVWIAALISSALFAARHAVQLQGPDYPLPAALVWVAACFVLGLGFAALYEWKRSIWPPVIAHTLFNVIPLTQMLAQ